MKIKKILSNIVCASLILSNLTIASASNVFISESSLDGEEFVNENYIDDVGIMPMNDTEVNTNIQSSTEDIKVTYAQVSDYSVLIPKTITLNKAKQGNYSIKVTGNIDEIQQVHVEPVDSVTSADGINFYMKDTAGKKADVLATVTQNKLYWDSEEAANGYEETNNTISAPRLTSGSWEGIFHIKISLESKDHEHNYVDDICTICGEINPDHAHNYQDGKCTVCGKIDSNHSHSYVDHVCTICGEIDPSHTHNYVDGVCTICNKQYLEAGLYDANDALLVSWEESGIDDNCNNAWSIISKNYPTTTKVVISDRVTEIYGDSDRAAISNIDTRYYFSFKRCENLTSIVIPDSVTTIGPGAFFGCISLKEIIIPDSVRTIGKYAFTGCTVLDNVIVPDSVMQIGQYAFSNCTHLTHISIPDSIKELPERVFSGCSLLKNVQLSNSLTTIGIYAFSSCHSLESIEIPNSVTSIGYDAFYDCYALKKVTLPSSLTIIESYLFNNCYALKEVQIPDSVKNIGTSAFYGCTGFDTLTIPDSVTNIGKDAFYNVNHIVYNGTYTSNKPWGAKSLN